MNSRLPSGEFLSKMFGLPQETHPERLFVLNEIGDAPGAVILDLGCGRHKTTERSIGVDILPVSDIQASIDNMPMIKDETVDIIISRHSFEHMLDPIGTLYEWSRVLKQYGKIIFVLPDHEALDTMNPILSGGTHCHAYTKDTFETLLNHSSCSFMIEKKVNVVDGWSFGFVVKRVSPAPKKNLYVADWQTPLQKMAEKIEKSNNFSFVKCGDGEMLAMLGAKGANCDGQQYSEKLGNALKDSYRFLGKDKNVKITRWKLPGMENHINNFEKELGIKMTEDHDLLMNRVGEITKDHYDFWKTIKNSKRRKIFVGPERLAGVIGFLNMDQMKIIPKSNAFEHKMEFFPEKNDIWIFSGGMAAKTWIAEVLRICPDVTCIDAGSAFDPVFVGYTRTNQISPVYIREFYKPLL